MLDAQGHALTTNSEEAARLFRDAQAQLLEYRLSAMPTVKAALEADPDFVMGNCLRAYMLLMFGTFTVLDTAKAAWRRAEAGAARATRREQLHVAAVGAWAEGRQAQALKHWQEILTEHPLDILALRVHHFTCFWTGRQAPLRSAAASVLDMWSPEIPGYGNVLGMLAFGYEENGQYREAERLGRRAVEHNPHDLWALHAVAHVLEMEDRQEDGIAWLTRPRDAWADRNPFRGHLWWHLALFNVESGNLDAALDLYDESVRNDGSSFYLDIQNAASLLARLELLGLDVGGRWEALAEHAEQHIGDHALIFTDLHYMIALAKAGRHEAAARLLSSMEEYARTSAADASEVVTRVGLPLCRGLLAFEQGRYDQAVDLMAPLHNADGAIGASHAQRDLVDQYLIEATIRARRLAQARALLAERVQMRPRNAAAAERYRSVRDAILAA